MFKSIETSNFIGTGIVPVEIILEDTDRRWRMQEMSIAKNFSAIVAVVIHHFDVIQMTISKIHFLTDEIQCQAQGHLYRIIDDAHTLLTIHAATFNTWVLAPISEKQESNASTWINGDRKWIGQVLVKQYSSISTIERGHFDMLENVVRPVQISTDPIVGNARYITVTTGDHLDREKMASEHLLQSKIVTLV